MVKSAITIPVIGSGDIQNAFDTKAMLTQAGCDSIMIGRAALGNPWIFSQVKRILAGMEPEIPTSALRFSTVIRHIESYREEYGEKKATNDLKKHLAWYCKGLPGAASLRNVFFRAPTFTILKQTAQTTFQPDTIF